MMRKKSEKICLFAMHFAQQKRQLHDQHGNPAGKVGIRQRLNAKMHFKDERCGGKHADSHITKLLISVTFKSPIPRKYPWIPFVTAGSIYIREIRCR